MYFGYIVNNTTYKYLDNEHSVIVKSSDIIFDKKIFSFNLKIVGIKKKKTNTEPSTSTLLNTEPNTSILPLYKIINPKFEPRRTKRIKVEKDFGL